MIKVLLSLLENEETRSRKDTDGRIYIAADARAHTSAALRPHNQTYPVHHPYLVSYYPTKANSLVSLIRNIAH